MINYLIAGYIDNAVAGIVILAISLFMFIKPEACADLINPTFMTEKLNMSGKSAYQVLGLIFGMIGLLMILYIIRVL